MIQESQYSLLLSFACATALLASTTSAGAHFSKSGNTPTPVPVVDNPPPARRPNLWNLNDEDFEALKAGTKFAEWKWTEEQKQKETDRREYDKQNKREANFYVACERKIKDIDFIDQRIKNVSEQTFFGGLTQAINNNESVVVRVFLERGQSKLSPKETMELIEYAMSREFNGNALEYFDYSTVDLEDVIILALKSVHHRNKKTVDMLLAKKGPDFTGGKLLLAAVLQMSTWRPSKDKLWTQLSAHSVMVRLLNEGDMDTKYNNYAALQHLSNMGRLGRDSNLRYFLKAGKVDPSDLKDGEFPDVDDYGKILNVDYLRKLVANEPPKGWTGDNQLQADEWKPNRNADSADKWELQYYPGAEAK